MYQCTNLEKLRYPRSKYMQVRFRYYLSLMKFYKKCKHIIFYLRYYIQCNKTASIAAHFTETRPESSCQTGLARMYFLCKSNSWGKEIGGGYYGGLDQLYCYESDESNIIFHTF